MSFWRVAKFFPFALSVSMLVPTVGRAAPHGHAESWILVEGTSTVALGGHNVDERRQPASLTKLMTAYVVLDAIKKGQVKWTDTVTVAGEDIQIVGNDEARMYLAAGQRVQLKDLVAGLIIASANDAANVLAHHVGGSNEAFSGLMNKAAKDIGMMNSHFITPSGISVPGHFSTAKDLAVLAQRLTADFPEYYTFSAQKHFAFKGFEKTSKNKLLGMGIGVDGLKTGHTIAAGWCIVATAKRPVAGGKGKRRVFAVLLGEPTARLRIADAKELLDFGFKSLK